MKKFNFKDLPNTDTPIKASTLNTMQSNIEESCVAVSPTQPETNERVWIDNENNIIKTKNNDGTFKTIYDESKINKTNYSTEEKVIGTWIDGRNIYQQAIIINNENLPPNSDGTIYEKNIKDISNNDIVFIKRVYIECASNSSSIYVSKFIGNFADKTDYTAVRGFMNNLLLQTTSLPYIKKACIVIEYTKITD